MKITRIITVLLCIVLAACSGQETAMQDKDVRELLKEVPERAGNLHYCYEAPVRIYDTPAPRGYKPFYVTHYGRHGSRYLNNIRTFDSVLDVLVPMKEKGLLTPSGDSLLAAIQTLREIHEGMEGFLTERGGRELYGIGRRLADRYPSVFTQKDRQKVLCASSPVNRCIQSMAHMSLGIQSEYPDIEFTLLSGNRYRSYLYRKNNMQPYFEIGMKVSLQTLEEIYDPTDATARFFKNEEVLKEYLNGKSIKEFFYDIYQAGDNVSCLEDGVPSVIDFFTEDERYAFWKTDVIKCYNAVGSCVENERYRPNWMGSALLKDFLAKADEAVAGGNRCADLRFGHDAVLGPFMFFLKLDGYDMHINMTEAPDCWYGFNRMNMGSNIQMVFYSNKAGDVLVKILRNESETFIPSVARYEGPYYRWEDLRNYFCTILQEEAQWESDLKATPDYVDIENLY